MSPVHPNPRIVTLDCECQKKYFMLKQVYNDFLKVHERDYRNWQFSGDGWKGKSMEETFNLHKKFKFFQEISTQIQNLEKQTKKE